jgi:hypothetical protein
VPAARRDGRRGASLIVSRTAGPERLNVLAALAEFDAERSDIADLWTYADGRPYADDVTALITSATITEWNWPRRCAADLVRP